MATQYINTEERLRQEGFIEENKTLLHNNKRYFIMTFGCQLNDNDSEKLAGQLERMGLTWADKIEEADVILVNTCSVRENAAGRFFGNLGNIKNYRHDNPNMIIGVCGCMMKQVEHVDKIKESYPFVDLVFGPQDIYRFPELLNRRLSGSRRVYDVGTIDTVAEDVPIRRERKFRALSTIMYGCNNFCSYCIVPYARGRERSRHQREVIEELKELAREGYSEVMLLGQNVNSYGNDLEHNAEQGDFLSLLEEAAETTGIQRIRFMSSHPKDISKELIDTIAKYPNIERHIHLALQSGSDEVLQAMNRKYTAEEFLDIVRYARETVPGISISTDIIVGYPGETDEDFEETMRVVEEAKFDQAFTFQFSPRPGTKAAKLEEIPKEVMTERFNRLVKLMNQNTLESNERIVGKTVEVLIEGLSDHTSDHFTGRDSANHLINFTIPENLLLRYDLADKSWDDRGLQLEGRFAQVHIDEAKTFSLEGTLSELN